MATAKLLEHLENIKIFSDFRKSNISDFNEFWSQIEKGRDPLKIRTQRRILPNPMPSDVTDEELIEAENQQEIQNAYRPEDQYTTKIRSQIESIIKWDTRPLLNLFELNQLGDIVFENGFLNEYIDISAADLEDYILFAKQTTPDKFFSILPQNQKTFASLIQEKQNNKYPRIFTDEGYELYLILREKLINSGSKEDFAYVYHKLRHDNYIHQATSNLYKEFIDDTENIFIDTLKSYQHFTKDGHANQKRNQIYSNSINQLNS